MGELVSRQSHIGARHRDQQPLDLTPAAKRHDVAQIASVPRARTGFIARAQSMLVEQTHGVERGRAVGDEMFDHCLRSPFASLNVRPSHSVQVLPKRCSVRLTPR